MTWSELPLVWKIFTVVVSVGMVTFLSIALVQSFKVLKKSFARGRPDDVVGNVAIYWRTLQISDKGKQVYLEKMPLALEMMDKYASGFDGPRIRVGVDKETGKEVYWDKGAIAKAIKKAGKLRVWVVDGPSYPLFPHPGQVAGHTKGMSGIVIAYRGGLHSTAFVHEVVHFVDIVLYDRWDTSTQHLGWKDRYVLVNKVNRTLENG